MSDPNQQPNSPFDGVPTSGGFRPPANGDAGNNSPANNEGPLTPGGFGTPQQPTGNQQGGGGQPTGGNNHSGSGGGPSQPPPGATNLPPDLARLAGQYVTLLQQVQNNELSPQDMLATIQQMTATDGQGYIWRISEQSSPPNFTFTRQDPTGGPPQPEDPNNFAPPQLPPRQDRPLGGPSEQGADDTTPVDATSPARKRRLGIGGPKVDAPRSIFEAEAETNLLHKIKNKLPKNLRPTLPPAAQQAIANNRRTLTIIGACLAALLLFAIFGRSSGPDCTPATQQIEQLTQVESDDHNVALGCIAQASTDAAQLLLVDAVTENNKAFDPTPLVPDANAAAILEQVASSNQLDQYNAAARQGTLTRGRLAMLLADYATAAGHPTPDTLDVPQLEGVPAGQVRAAALLNHHGLANLDLDSETLTADVTAGTFVLDVAPVITTPAADTQTEAGNNQPDGQPMPTSPPNTNSGNSEQPADQPAAVPSGDRTQQIIAAVTSGDLTLADQVFGPNVNRQQLPLQLAQPVGLAVLNHNIEPAASPAANDDGTATQVWNATNSDGSTVATATVTYIRDGDTWKLAAPPTFTITP